MTAASLAQFYSGPVEALQRPDRAFVRDVNLMFGTVPSLQTTRALVREVSQSVKSLHGSTPHIAKKHAMERPVEKITKASSLPELLSAALRRRMTAASGLTDIVLAHALGVSRQTVWTWLNGISQPKGHHLVALISFFDASFANEILGPTAGCTVAKMSDARAVALRKVAEGMAELKAMEGA